MAGLVSVNDARIIIDKDGSLTAAVSSGDVYEGKFKRAARKREVNVKILANSDNDYLIRRFPLFDKSDVIEMRNDSETNKFVHIGCITVSIEPLIHNRFLETYGKNIKGVCAIIDSTFRDVDQSIISLHRFTLDKKRSDFICNPNHCLSVTDQNLLDRISLVIALEGIDVEEGNELFNICIGHITTCSNTLNPSGIKNKTRVTSITGAEEVKFEEVKETLAKAMTGKGIGIEDGEDQILMKRGNILQRFGLVHTPKIVVRRNYISAGPEDKRVRRTQSLPRNSLDKALLRCASSGLYPSLQGVSEKDAKNKIREMRQMALEEKE